MSSFLDRLRSGANKAAFEADKLKRITSLQNQVRSLRSDFGKMTTEVGQVAYRLHRANEVTQPKLLTVCQRLDGVEAQIGAKEQEIEQIRREVFMEETFQIGSGHVCPNGHGALPPQDKFCQICGAQAINITPLSGNPCTNCGVNLAADARFCSNCGQTVATELPTNEAAQCEKCEAMLLQDSVFCAECGHRVAVTEDVGGDREVREVIVEEMRNDVLKDHISELETEGQDISTEEPTSSFGEEFVFSEGVTEFEEKSEAEIIHLASEVEISHSEADAIAETCPTCHATLLPDAIFCAECGFRLPS
jgi:DNA-directed RNA polymerase subunit RPC12/RpoP